MKFLVIRFSSIGDVVLTTPVLRCLKKKYPDAQIHYLTKAQFHPLLAANPYITKFHLLEDDLEIIIEDLKAEKFDYVIDLHKNIRSMRVKKAVDAKTISFNKLNLQKWLAVNLKVDTLPDKHIVDRYFDSLAKIGVKNDGQGLDYYIWEKEVNDYISSIGKTPYIAFAIGAQHKTKKLPDDKIIEICERVNGKIILLGGKTEAALGDKINSILPAKIINLCGKTNLNESAYLVKHAKKVIAHDTGFMHVAAAFQKPVISIWGNTVPAFGMYPYFGSRNLLTAEKQSFIFEVDGLPCRPCTKLGYDKCPREHFKCMNGQDINKIVEVVNG
ncbi:MAG: glycosyltransferase family 9 protein [Bacteroidia bacterium]